MAKAKRLNRGAVACSVVCIACAAAFLAARFFSSSTQSSLPASEETPASLPSATYEATIPFELIGAARDVDKDGNETYDPWDFEKGWDWTGTMRFTVSGATLYDSSEDAGFSLPGDDKDFYAGARMLAVNINVQNLDAACRESAMRENGAPSFNLTMFTLKAAGGRLIEPYCFMAPSVEGLTWDDGKSQTYTWVEAGSSATIRIGYPVFIKGDALPETRTRTVADGVKISVDDDLQMVLQNGWYDGAPVVELGAPQIAEEPYVAE